MEHEGAEGDPLELFGDNNLESDLRQLFSPSTSPNLSFGLPDASYSSSAIHNACPPLDAGSRVKHEHDSSAPGGELNGARGDFGGAGKPNHVISERELREHFGIPLNEVAAKFGICITALKKLCRRYGVRKWPHRRLLAVERRLQVIADELKTAPASVQATLQVEAAQLKLDRERIYEGKGQDFEDSGSLDFDGEETLTERLLSSEDHPPASAPPPRTTVKQEEGRGGPAPKGKGPGKAEREREQGGEPVGMIPMEHGQDGQGASWLDVSSSSSAPPGAYLPSEDVAIVAPDHDAHISGALGGGSEVSQLERLEEENSSLRAISKYLMQERKELARKAELSAKRNHNLYCLSRVLKLRLGVLEDSSGGLDSSALGALDELGGGEGEGGAQVPLEFNAEGLLAEPDPEDTRQGGATSSQDHPADHMHTEGKGSPFHQDPGICWFAPGHGGEHGDDLLNDLI